MILDKNKLDSIELRLKGIINSIRAADPVIQSLPEKQRRKIPGASSMSVWADYLESVLEDLGR